jgi:hypothetical protein
MMQHRSGSPPLPACRAARTTSQHSSGAASAEGSPVGVGSCERAGKERSPKGVMIPHHMNARTHRQASIRRENQDSGRGCDARAASK